MANIGHDQSHQGTYSFFEKWPSQKGVDFANLMTNLTLSCRNRSATIRSLSAFTDAKFTRALSSGYTFWLILQKMFDAFWHRKLKMAQTWSTHQSTALIFYFGMKKISSWIFDNFVENRQTKFHEFKFSVCVCLHTP